MSFQNDDLLQKEKWFLLPVKIWIGLEAQKTLQDTPSET
jgi:hypothetical protein